MVKSSVKSDTVEFIDHLERREAIGKFCEYLFLFGLLIGLFVLALLVLNIAHDGLGRLLTPGFLTETPSRFPERGGIRPAIIGSFYLGIIVLLVAVPIGVGSALYLEEYAPKTWWTALIEVNIGNLAGVPSIVYGLLGLAVFNYLLNFGPTLISGALTLALLSLPVIIVTAREAIRAVPDSLRQASYGLGSTKWQTIQHHVLPYAVPGILTGVIISVSRAIGDAASLMVVGAVSFLTFDPGLFQRFMALPIQIFSYITRPEPGFANAAAAAIIVLILLILALNAIAIYLRQRYSTLN
ncbi:MAG: phosphate ABC transporter permease PstA [Microcystis sp. M048S1]|jgi:phosphate transport system permease protein|uniref:Phosphate transport system permease protein PstA n=11 Tax=Microcystis TaxID=1125 RepID=A0A0A1W0C1_MICAE|nr:MULTISPECIES: phosphate ABC transporter permease PstA [Microcystis]MCA2902082.1 phosphate ABC transporter permease PstA [Microcystis sp. M035S1]MCZ8100638.1 phosphate ABC transporter permease PstA [Burkholderiales bacterium]MCZ8363752.1 phosphate ABC transporter permease PstA [Microcystis sp. LE19-251.1A]MDJ0528821.1 phosphate ABC transporter permease PstA [Microcystis sp. M53600_WE12]MDJ0544293.1 phosphate ABC transporter permease PstA [Microcystis sp. M53601_WE4]NCR79328.1 phosphate ABC 